MIIKNNMFVLEQVPEEKKEEPRCRSAHKHFGETGTLIEDSQDLAQLKELLDNTSQQAKPRLMSADKHGKEN